MKITTFNPLIVTKDAAPVIKLFEEMGFVKRHTKEGISDDDIRNVRMKDAGGFHVDIAQADFGKDLTLIRMNVDNLDEAMELLFAHGFRRARSASVSETVDTGSSKFNIVVSPSGFIMDVSQHIKE